MEGRQKGQSGEDPGRLRLRVELTAPLGRNWTSGEPDRRPRRIDRVDKLLQGLRTSARRDQSAKTGLTLKLARVLPLIAAVLVKCARLLAIVSLVVP